MYKIFADDVLIYDSTTDDYKIGKGNGALETNKAGSFTFCVYPEHFFYDRFVKKKTVIIVTKSDRILFRGRVLDDQDDMWKRRDIICEGELNFLQDSFIRPYTFTGTPEEAFRKYITEHNSQVDEFKRFKIGMVTVHDPNNYIARSNSNYENSLKNLTSRLLEDSLGGYFHITHGDDGKDPIPTLHYLADFTEVSSQNIEFGSNLKDYLKKGTGQAIATAIIPLGARLDDGNTDTDNLRLTIAAVNNGLDYVYDEAAVAEHGWIFDTVIYDDVTLPANLKARGLADLARRIRENTTLELTAVDLHLLDRSIDSFRYNTYVRCVSPPHNFAETLLCHRQTFNVLRPDSDTVTLGTSYPSFTGSVANSASVAEVRRDVANLNYKTGQYKIAEQRLTSLMAQSFGVFKTEKVLADGSTVYYMHDKPTLEASTNIWKMTSDAFSVSSDGGKTWNAGMDAEGHAILNILSVIGINASWINADNLTAISSNLGGWKIDNEGIYQEFVDKDDYTYRYRIRINAPPMGSIQFDSTEPIIQCSRSNDGGQTFLNTFEVTGQGGVYLGDYRSGNTHASLSNGGLNFVLDDQNILQASPLGLCLVSGVGANRREIACLSKNYDTGETTCQADRIIAQTAHTGAITLGGITMVFVGGVLTNAYYA